MPITPLASLSQAVIKNVTLPSISSLKSGFGSDIFRTQKLGHIKSLEGLSEVNFGQALNNVSKLASSRNTEASDAFKPEVPKPSFSPAGMAMDFVKSVDAQGKASQSEANKIFSNQSNNVHQSMISLQESKAAFNLMVKMRNEFVAGIKEIMNMSV